MADKIDLSAEINKNIEAITKQQSLESLAIELRSALHQYPNFPSEGILFEDFLPIFASPSLFSKLITAFMIHIKEKYANVKVDYIIGLEARGFLFGPSLALALGCGFIPVRKAGKLPGEVAQATYVKEYGSDVFEMQLDAMPEGSNVIIVDDIIATGGSAVSAYTLVKKLNCNVLEFAFVMELDFLKGRERLQAPVFTLLSSQKEALK
ncbi:adenine phosphoribosyltransferase [Hanseniaspora opuntiae]|jgi:adenine phosphoribosyltransferase